MKIDDLFNFISVCISSSLATIVLSELVKYFFVSRLDKNKLNKEYQIHCKKLLFVKRLEYIEMIISTMEKIKNLILTVQDQNEIFSLISRLSKDAIPRTTYFTKEENVKIEELLDILKLSNCEFDSLRGFEHKLEDLKVCLGIILKSQK